MLARLCLILLVALQTPDLQAAPAPPGVLRFRLTGDPATLDWNVARSSHETHVIMNVMEGLVELDQELKPRPALAERWEVSPDGRTYTFHLRKGVLWSDGQPLRASQFTASWERLRNPKTGSSYASFLSEVQSAKALDDEKLEIRLSRPLPYFLQLLSFWVTFPIRADLVKRYGPRWAMPGKLATLGPFELVDWEKGKAIRLRRNAKYHARDSLPAVAPTEIRIRIESDDQRARALFESGELDILLDATTADLMKAREKPALADSSAGARAEQFPYLATYYLGFQVKAGPLRDPGIRKALMAAIDRAAIPGLLQGGQQAAQGWIPPGMDGFSTAITLGSSLYQAQGALQRAGYPEGRGFPPLTVWVEKFDGADTLAEHLVKSFRDKLGIELRSKVATPVEYQSARRSGRAEIFVGHWGADYPDPSNFFEVFLSSSGTNPAGWRSADYDKLVMQAKTSLDRDARVRLYAEAEKILIEKDAVILPLFYKRNVALLGPQVRELRITPLNYLFLKSVALSGR